MSDEFTVPLCRGHHREVHRSGDEAAWWGKASIDPTAAARALWLKTHPLPTISVSAHIEGPTSAAAAHARAEMGKIDPSVRTNLICQVRSNTSFHTFVVKHDKSAVFPRRNGGASFMAGSSKTKAASLISERRETIDLYDLLLFIGKPDLSRYGFKRSRTVYQNELWPSKADYTTPNEAAVRSKADAVLAEGITAAVPVILDVELYSVDVRLDPSHMNPDTSTVDANILKLEQIIGWFKDEAPTLKVGFYDVPLVDGFPVTGHQPANDTNWLYGRWPTHMSFHSLLT